MKPPFFTTTVFALLLCGCGVFHENTHAAEPDPEPVPVQPPAGAK